MTKEHFANLFKIIKKISLVILLLSLNLPPYLNTQALANSTKTITRKQLETMLIQTLKKNPQTKKLSLVLERSMIPPKLFIPTGKISMSVKLQNQPNTQSGYINIIATLLINNSPIRYFVVRGRSIQQKTYLVFKRKVKRGEIISQEDIEFRKIPQRKWAEHLSVQDVCGMQLLQNVYPGQPVSRRLLRKPILVKRGELVIIVYENDNLSITTIGKAMRDGSLHEVIPVTNIDSNKLIYAEVIKRNRVSVSYVTKKS